LKKISIVFIAAILASCSSTGYVLHDHPKSGVFFGDATRFPIVSAGKVALLYDREPWVMFENKMSDGSVWVHYALTVKNAGDSTVNLQTQKVRLQGNGLEGIPGEYSVEDKVGAREAIEGGTYYRLTVRFRLPAKWIEDALDQKTPVELVAPIDASELKLKLWLWKV